MEIELKLLVAPEDLDRIEQHPALRELRRWSGRIERLATTYYDTPDFQLAREGVALRVRRNGEHWIQTLKTEGEAAAGLHVRDELEWPLAAGEIDLAALDATPYRKLFGRKRVRDRLGPVFTTEFDRAARMLSFADGTAAELAIDRGEIRAGSRTAAISEAEIELKTGDALRLFELAREIARDVPLRLGHASKAERGYALARDAVPPPQKARAIELGHALSASAALRRIALACVAQMQANEAGMLEGKDPEYLHQFRVGLRRLRSCLGLVGMAAGKEATAPLAEELRWLGGMLGPARDWDVFATETLARLAREFRGAEGLAGFRAHCTRLRRAHGEAAREAVRSPRYTALLLALGEAFARDDLVGLQRPPTDDAAPQAVPPERPGLSAGVLEFAAFVLEKRDRRLRKDGKRVPAAPPDERHRVRIAAKKLRYAAEFLASLYPRKRVERFVAALEDLQDILGALNDAAVVGRLLEEAAAKAPIAPRVEGLIRGWVAAAAQGELARYKRAWRAFDEAKPFWR